ncbi:proteinase inhibitor, partial [Phtheirospermum japonicum]
GGLSSWQVFVAGVGGKNGEAAAAVIEQQNSNVDAIVLPPGSVVIQDFRCDRVWVWVNESGVVTRTPTIG